jgi:hypothetical protein
LPKNTLMRWLPFVALLAVAAPRRAHAACTATLTSSPGNWDQLVFGIAGACGADAALQLFHSTTNKQRVRARRPPRPPTARRRRS